MSDLEKAKFSAVNNFGGGAVVFLLEGAIGSPSNIFNGSGSVLRSPGGRLFVLTARHVFEDDANGDPRPFDFVQSIPFAIGGRAVRYGLADALGRQFWHPSVDVAIALLKPHAAEQFANAALSLDMVANPTDDATDGLTVMLCGFPAGYRLAKVDHKNKHVDFGFASVTYATEVRGKDEKGRHRARWADDAEMTGTIPMQADDSWAAQRLGIAGRTFELVHPGGISGGPLWRFANVPLDEIWDPSKFARIVGVASAYIREDDAQMCPSVSTWGEWFHETVAKIDADTT